jgi:mannosyltransferase
MLIKKGINSGVVGQPQSTTAVWLLGLTLMALLLRVIGLNSGLWLDEFYSVVNQFRLSPIELFTTYVGDNQHPLYALLASICVSVFGEAPWVVRLPALVFGVATIPALYCLGCRVGSHKEAVFSAALLAVSYHHIWFSQNARAYSAIALAAILCTDRFLCLLDSRRHKDVWLYAVIVALGCYAHLTMVFIVIGQFLVSLLWFFFLRDTDVRRQSWQLPLAAFVLSGILTLLLYAPIFTQVVDYFINKPSGMEELSTHSWALSEALRSLKVGLGGGVILVVGFWMAILGLGSFYKTNKIALGIFICSILVTFFIAFFARGTMYPRFFFFLAGFFILIGARGVVVTMTLCAQLVFRSEQQQKYTEWLSITAMLVIISVSAFSMMHNYKYPKMDFEGAKHWAEAQAGPNDSIVTAGVAAWPYQVYFGVDWPEMKLAEDIERVRKQSGRIWMVYTFGRYMKKSAPEIYTVVDQECSEKKRFRGTLGGGDMIVCRLEVS